MAWSSRDQNGGSADVTPATGVDTEVKSFRLLPLNFSTSLTNNDGVIIRAKHTGPIGKVNVKNSRRMKPAKFEKDTLEDPTSEAVEELPKASRESGLRCFGKCSIGSK